MVLRPDQKVVGIERDQWLANVLLTMRVVKDEKSAKAIASAFPYWRLPGDMINVCAVYDKADEWLFFDQVVHKLAAFDAIGIMWENEVLLNRQRVIHFRNENVRVVTFPDPYGIAVMAIAPFPDPSVVYLFCHRPRTAVYYRPTSSTS